MNRVEKLALETKESGATPKKKRGRKPKSQAENGAHKQVAGTQEEQAREMLRKAHEEKSQACYEEIRKVLDKYGFEDLRVVHNYEFVAK